MINPDTLIVISGSPPAKDYSALLSGLLASVLVAVMAWYSTRTQRKIAEEATVTQRGLAKDSVDAQLEIATIAQVGESRREWRRELRKAIAEFESTALSLSDIEKSHSQQASASASSVGSPRDPVELMRLMTLIALMLDPKEPGHADVIKCVNAVTGFAIQGDDGIPAAKPNEARTLTCAREFKSMGDALRSLDLGARVVLEKEWEKIKTHA
jgi:hypothetical protein